MIVIGKSQNSRRLRAGRPDPGPARQSAGRGNPELIDVDAYESELAQEERDLEAIAQLKRQILKQ